MCDLTVVFFPIKEFIRMSHTLHGTFVVGTETLQKGSSPKFANASLAARRKGLRSVTRPQSVAEAERAALSQSTHKKVRRADAYYHREAQITRTYFLQLYVCTSRRLTF